MLAGLLAGIGQAGWASGWPVGGWAQWLGMTRLAGARLGGSWAGLGWASCLASIHHINKPHLPLEPLPFIVSHTTEDGGFSKPQWTFTTQ